MNTAGADTASSEVIAARTTPAHPVPPFAASEFSLASGPIRKIVPARGWQLLNLRELWEYRELLYFLAWRDFKVRYKQTLLGVVWAVIQPVMMMLVFTVVFGRLVGVPTGGLPAPIFFYSGLLPWMFFAASVARAGNSVVNSERIITKVYFPRLAIPIAAIGAALIDFAIAFSILILLMIYYGIVPGAGLLLVPALVVIMTMAALGIGTLLAALNVAYRDFRYVIPFLMQIWMFATPGVYMSTKGDQLPKVLETLLALNPMTGVIGAFRAATLDGTIPWQQLGISSAVIGVSFLVGCFYFKKVEDGFADII